MRPPALAPADRIDGLTYTLSGADAGYFHVVPATGQILTLKKLNYEDQERTTRLPSKRWTRMGEYDTIPLTINVLDVEESARGRYL